MRWTSRQHLQMAQHLDAKAHLATGEKKARLASLAATARLLATMAVKEEGRYRAEMPRIAEALFHPSFHPETLLRVIADSDRTTVELTSAESIVARRFTHKTVVAPSYAARFWTNLDAILLAPFDI